MTGNSTRGRRPFRWPGGAILWAVLALLSAALTCGEIERRTEAVDPMYQEDEIDVLVDYGATLQAQEATATARASGPPKPPAVEAEEIPQLPEQEESPADDTGGEAAPAEEESAPPITDFAGSWHSAETCDEADAPYRWEIKLSQDESTNRVWGTISFHACPGGGRASYSVSGTATAALFVDLEGTKQSGRGGIGSAASASQTFRIRPGLPPEPNLAP